MPRVRPRSTPWTTWPVARRGGPEAWPHLPPGPSSTNSRILVDEHTSPSTMTAAPRLTPMFRRGRLRCRAGLRCLSGRPKGEIPAYHHVASVRGPLPSTSADEGFGGQGQQSRKCERLDHDRHQRQPPASSSKRPLQRQQPWAGANAGGEESRGMGGRSQDCGLTTSAWAGDWRGPAKARVGRSAHRPKFPMATRRRAQRTPQVGRDALAGPE